MRPLTLALSTAAASLVVLTKAGANTYGLPDGAPLRRQLRRWFNRQLAAVLGTIAEIGVGLPDALPAMTGDDDPMAAAMTPLISAYWNESGQRVMERLGLDPNAWSVVDPNVRRMIERASFAFCHATNETTSLALDAALSRLRQELAEGIVEQGDTLKQLRKRVSEVFDDAEKWRAQRIAASEASRAVHAAEIESARQSGVVVGVRWLLSDDACPLCQRVAAEVPQVRLGEPFAILGDHPDYATVRHPPLHPGCQCSLTEVLAPEYGGPENPQWAAALQQPRADGG